jgi:hypothetical protein
MKQIYRDMKKVALLIVFSCIAILVNAQESEDKNNASFNLGSGLNFSFNEGNYQFNLGGFITPTYSYNKDSGSDAENTFNSRNSFFILAGKAVNEKVSFLVQTDYSQLQPLLDAWLAYHPRNNITITFGQKQSFVNNREMTYREDRLQFTNRSLLSQTLSNTGREFGMFIESKFKVANQIGIAPMVAVTSGDGRNSFGSDSRDSDLGGLKIGGRLDVYPLGYFTEGNNLFSADLAHEQKLKFVIGAAFSKNTGASNAVGEGHGDFFLFDVNGNDNLPDYSQVYIDLLLKYKGFSLSAEYANASADGLDLMYTDEAATQILAPQQISEFLVLGDSYNFQAGYVTKKGFGFDFRYESATPEFESNLSSLLTDYSSFTLGLTKYFDNNNLKMQAALSTIDVANGNSQTVGEFLIQVVF